MKNIVAITACPTGIAHTYMAAEALSALAKTKNCTIAVETQGSSGAQSVLTEDQIAQADVVIIAADTAVDMARFAGKVVYETTTANALKKTESVFAGAEAAIKAGTKQKGSKTTKASESATSVSAGNAVYKHLMTGVSFMLPFVVAGGLLIAIGFAMGGIHVYENVGTLGERLFSIGKASFGLMIPILAGYIAYSIADRPGLTPGAVGGVLASAVGAGFLGAIVAGFVAGYTAKALRDKMHLPAFMESLKPVLIIPLLSTIVTGLVVYYVIGAPAKVLLDAMTSMLTGMSSSSAIVLGLILGAMMALDLGGPVNKAAYVFGTGLLASNVTAPMAAVMAAGMVPPMAVFLATLLRPSKFTTEEVEGGKAAGLLGISFISEGAIPYAAKDPARVIPSFVLGGATAGALSMVFGAKLAVPHGGIFAMFIPGAVTNVAMYFVALFAGVAVSAVALILLKKDA